MNFKSIIKSLITESRELIGQYDVNGQYVDVLFNTHSNISTNCSAYGRLCVEDIHVSIEDILGVIIEVSNSLLNSSNNQSNSDKSILVVDNQIGADYHFWINKSKRGVLYLTINTSIQHPKHLPNKKNDSKIIITKNGDTIVKESIDNTFTSKNIGNIIVYYKIY